MGNQQENEASHRRAAKQKRTEHDEDSRRPHFMDDALELLEAVDARIEARLQLRLPSKTCDNSKYGPPRPVATLGAAECNGEDDRDNSVLQLFRGASNSVALPCRISLIVHEIIGHVMSSEGVAKAIHEV